MEKKLYTGLAMIILSLALLIILMPEDMEVINSTEIDIPEISGTVANLPWTEDEDFLKAQKNADAYVLMAGFCTVFENPQPNEEFNVHLAAKSVAGVVIQPNEIFSQNNTIGPYDEEKGYKSGESYVGSEITTTIGGGVCKMATTLYNASVFSDLEVVERYNHFMPVPYVPYGQDATVAYGSKDLKFKNITEFPILIWAEGIENRLYLALYGREKPSKVEWSHKILSTLKASTINKINPNLPKGTERVLVEGMDGAFVQSWVIVTDSDGSMRTKDMGNSRYWPMPYIIETNK